MTEPPELDNWFLVDLFVQRICTEIDRSLLVRLLRRWFEPST